MKKTIADKVQNLMNLGEIIKPHDPETMIVKRSFTKISFEFVRFLQIERLHTL